MRKKITVLFVFIFSMRTAYAQHDTLFRTGVGINVGELVDILRSEPNLRISLEQRFLKRYSVLIEPGIYFTGSGYNFKAAVKRHTQHQHANGSPDYLGVAWGIKAHFYTEPVENYKDSTHSAVTSGSLHVEKRATTFDFISGWIVVRGNFYMDVYCGLGVRFREVKGVSRAQYDMMEDNVGRSFELIPGRHVVPDLTAGIRVGLQFRKK